MIISRTPYRVSFFGGGTDYPTWFSEHGGAVLTSTIDKYCYLSARYLPPFFDHKHRIIYSKVENVSDASQIKHPAAKAVLQYMGFEEGLEIHHDGDLPARSGLGSSSAFTVGLLNALKALREEFISKEELAKTAIYIEQDLIKETVGSQDQIETAYGGLNRIDFKTDGSFTVNPILMNPDKRLQLEDSLMLFFTGLSRFSSEIAITKVDNFKNCNSQLKAMRDMVDVGCELLQSKSGTIADVGQLLHESWKLKRELSTSVSNDKIDAMYQAGIEAGAYGGKILGAGGGGFILFIVKPELKARLRERLTKLLNVQIRFENAGSKIMVYDPQIATK